ncbi:MAG: DUF362 domain-containing protein [Kiritimatiellia bacterium]|jgi:ferredoxin
MAFEITDKCTACGKCAESCPVEAISKSKDEKRYVIDEEKCVECGVCAGECPVEAIKEK